MEEILLEKLDFLITKFIDISKKFVEYSAYREGTVHYMISSEIDAGLINEYEYLIFTKSSKSLISIKQLLKIGHNEDVAIILRSIFEGYLSCRYFNESDLYKKNKSMIFEDMIFNPINISLKRYHVRKGEVYCGRKVVGKALMPKNFRIGADRGYYFDLYSYFSELAHPNYSTVDLFADDISFTLNKSTNNLFIRFLTVFIFTRLFEYVVTVEGEDFLNSKTMNTACQLVKKSHGVLENIIDYFLEADNYVKTIKGNGNYKNMLVNMKVALKEQISDVTSL